MGFDLKTYRYGFKKDGQYYTIHIYGNISDTSTTAYLRCGYSDSELDPIYNDLLKSQVVLETFDSGLDTDIFTFSITQYHDKYPDGLITIAYFPLFSFTDPFYSYHVFSKVDEEWVVLWTGQMRPPCELLEKNGVKPGVKCTDFNTEDWETRVTW